MRVRTVARALAASPAVTAALTVAVLVGAVGAAYPAAFLGEPEPPGLLAGLMLGAVAAGLAAPLWCAPVALWLGAGGDPCGVRVVQHAAGAGVARRRGAELATLAAVLAAGAVAAALGGAASTLAQGPALDRAPAALLPGGGVVLVALGAAAATVLAWLLGIAVRHAALGLVLYGFAVGISFALAGLGYFADWARAAAVFLPFGSVIPSVASEFVSRQYAGDATAALRAASAALWAAAIVAAAAYRTVRSVR